MTVSNDPLSQPLRNLPRAFKWCFWLSLAAAIAGYVTLAILRPGVPLGDIVLKPGFLLLVALILLSDLYPLTPWMRGVPDAMIIWSAPLTLGAVLAFGPQASYLFLLSGICVIGFRRGGATIWRSVFNMSLWGLQGLVAASAQILLVPGSGGEIPTSAAAVLLVGVITAVLLETVNGVLISTAMAALNRRTWSTELKDWLRTGFPWGAPTVVAPVVAVIATSAPVLLPLLAPVLITVHHGIGMLTSRTDEARSDALTGLANRSTLFTAVTSQLSGLRRRGGMVTVMLVDLDRFKIVNDNHGHAVGDAVLTAVADRLRQITRPGDLVSRYGGDEFAVLLTQGTSEIASDALAAAISSTLAEPYRLAGLELSVGGTVGVARTNEKSVDAAELIAVADGAMYRRKDPGRPVARQVNWTISSQGTATWTGSKWSDLSQDPDLVEGERGT